MCQEKGNLYQLRQRLGLNVAGIQSLGQALHAEPKRIPRERVEAMHRALLADDEGLTYATTIRGWSLEVVKRIQVGVRVDNRGKWLMSLVK